MAINKGKILQNAQKYVLQGKYELAIEEYKKIVQDNPKDWNTFIQIGNLYLKIGKNAEAIANLKKVADYYYQDGQHVKAIALYKQINRIDPALEAISLKLADLFIKQGLIMEAKSQLVVLGEHFTKKGQINQAAEVFKKLIELEPDNLKAKMELAKIFKSLGDINAAITEYLTVSEGYEKQNSIAESIKILEEALEIQPSNVEILKRIVALYNKSGDAQKAIDLLEKLIESKKATPEIYMQLAASFFRNKNYNKTEEILRKCIEIDSLYLPAYDSLLQLLINGDKIDEAGQLVDSLSLKLIQKREGEKAIPFLNQLLEIIPERIDFAERLAEIYIDLHQETNAISILNKLTESLIANKEYKEAEKIIKKIMVYEPDNVQYQEKLRLVASYLRPEVEVKPEKVKQEKEKTTKQVAKEPVRKVEITAVSKEEGKEIEKVEDKTTQQQKITEELQPPKVEKIADEIGIDEAEQEIEIEIELPEEELMQKQGGAIKEVEVDKEKEVLLDKEIAPEEASEVGMEEAEEQYNQLEIDEMHEFIREHLIEAEVFNKYGLADKAIEQLEMIINRYPLTIEAYLKLKDIYLHINDKNKAAKQYIRLIKLFKKKGDKAKVDEFIKEAKKIAPTHSDLLDLIGEKPKKDAFIEMQKLEELYTSRKASKDKTKKSVFKDLDELELEIDITRDIEDIASIKEIMEGEEVKEESQEIEETAFKYEKESQTLISEIEPQMEVEEVQEISEPSISDKQKEEAAEIIIEEQEEEKTEIYALGIEDSYSTKEEEKRADYDVEKIKDEIIQEFQEIDIPIGGMEEKGSDELEFKVSQATEQVTEKGFDDSIAELSNEKITEEIEIEEQQSRAIQSETSYAESIIQSIDSKLKQEDYDGAEEIIEEASALYGDLPFLIAKREEIQAAKLKKEVKEKEMIEKEEFGELEEVEEISFQEEGERQIEQPKESFLEKEITESKKEEMISDDAFIIEEEGAIDFAVGITEEELDREALASIGGTERKDEASSTSEMEVGEIFTEEKKAKEHKQEFIIESVEKKEEQMSQVEEEKETTFIETIEIGKSETEPQQIENMEEEVISMTSEEESFFDLASELENEMLSVTTAVETESVEPTSQVSLEEVFNEFKKGVEKQIDTQDYETRYNLGIAYKEMGLVDDAIAEFQIASKDPKKFLECCSLLGLCFIEKGLPKLAIKWYEKGLSTSGYSEEEYQSLKYELANTYELLGELNKAYDIYLEVYAINANYRDVAQKIKELELVIKAK